MHVNKLSLNVKKMKYMLFTLHKSQDPVESQHGLSRQLLAALDVAVIYVNKDLTKIPDTLLWKARKLNKAKMIKGCWSYDGLVMIQNNHGHAVSS